MSITGHAYPSVVKRYNVRRDAVQAELPPVAMPSSACQLDITRTTAVLTPRQGERLSMGRMWGVSSPRPSPILPNAAACGS